MSNGLNIRLVNEVNTIAQGDTASTVIVELLDETGTVIPSLNGRDALINFIDKKNEIKYQIETVIFDSRVEFNIDGVIPHGDYHVEFRVYADDETYVFPSNVNYRLKINRSANDYYTRVIDSNGIEIIVNEVIGTIESGFPGLLEHTERQDNPHKVSKEQVGLGNVEDVEQATKVEFDEHVNDNEIHVTQSDKDDWNNKADEQDIQAAIEEMDTVDIQTFDSHVTNEELHFKLGEREAINNHLVDENLHWKEGEKEAISGDINRVSTDIENLIDGLSEAGVYGDLPLIEDDNKFIEGVKAYRKSDDEVVFILWGQKQNYGGTLIYMQQRVKVNAGAIKMYLFSSVDGNINLIEQFNIVQNSTALGVYASATGDYSTALGVDASATGDYSTALGADASATGDHSTALGLSASATLPNLGAFGSNSSFDSYWWKAHQFYAEHALGTEKAELGTVRRYPSLVSAGSRNTVYTGKVLITEENVDTAVDLPAHVVPRVRPENIVIVTPNDDLALCCGKINNGRQLIVKADKVGEYSFVVYYDWANVDSSTRDTDKSWPRT